MASRKKPPKESSFPEERPTDKRLTELDKPFDDDEPPTDSLPPPERTPSFSPETAGYHVCPTCRGIDPASCDTCMGMGIVDADTMEALTKKETLQ